MARVLPWPLALCLLLADAAGFTPFAGVEELGPKRLRPFCSGEVDDTADPVWGRPRWCQHSVRKQLEDGGDVEFSWRMHADPDRILSLDTEAEHGVRLTSCRPDALELQLPESHALRASEGEVVVGSRFVHGCEHLPERHMYHRVLAVRGRKQGRSEDGRTVHHVHVSTQELPSFEHAVRSMSFSFSYMPAEARDVVKHPEMRTDYGLNRELLRRRRQERRLMGFPFHLPHKLSRGVETENGGFQHGGRTGGLVLQTQNGILNFQPKQVSNFGWNWNFAMNTTEEPNLNITIPGARGIIKIRKPYIRIHSGIYLNFTSEFKGLKSPMVRWTAGMNGHGHVQARVLAVLNTTSTAGVDPLKAFDLPMLEQLREPQWFQKIDIASGEMPLSFEPGFQFKAKMYHTGTFHGAVAFGIKTHGVMSPKLSYDSKVGFDLLMRGTLIDTDVIPPLWMIFTKRFEMGIMFMPSLLMRGDFGGLEKATLALELRPYMNITVTREGEGGGAGEDDLKTLTAYPIRVMGISEVLFQKKYKVRVETLGQSVDSTAEMNWGEVSFHDHVSKFAMGQISEKAVMQQSIQVTLFEVDDSLSVPQEKSLGSGSVRCTSLLSGECHPSPPIAIIKVGATDIAAVELAVLWQDNPELWFAQQIRGVSVTFPQVVLRQDALQTAFPSAMGSATEGTPSKELNMHLVHGGRTYTVPIEGDPDSQTVPLRGATAVEFGPAFLETWLPCPASTGSKCESPRLELYYGETQIAVANLPQIEWTSQTAMQGTAGSPFAGGDGLNVPSTVALYKPGGQTTSIAVALMNAKVVNPAASSLFLQPIAASELALGSQQPFAWAVEGVDRAAMYEFRLQPLRLIEVSPVDLEKYVAFRKVSNRVLMPIFDQPQIARLQCQAMAVAGMSADEAPCTFTQKVVLGSGYKVGDQVVLRVSWSKQGQGHEVYSPAFEVTAPKQAAGERRRLRSEAHWQLATRQLLSDRDRLPRRLFSKDTWNSRMNAHKNCQNKDLHFNIGGGMLVRGRVDNVGVPKGFPMIGGLDEAPELTTGFRRIAAFKNGTTAQDLLPPSICQEGLCKGALPGCTNADFKKINFPKLIINKNRPFHFNRSRGRFHGLIREAMAFAFSTLPEMVDIAIKELNETNFFRGTTTRPQFARRPRRGTPAPLPSLQRPAPTQPPQDSHETNSAFEHWWNIGKRRLAGATQAEEEHSVAEAPSRLETGGATAAVGQIVVRFKQGLGFRLDRPLVEMMMRHGYFEEVEDDATEELGQLHTTSFTLEEEDGPPEELREVLGLAASGPAEAPAAPPAAAARGIAVAALLAAAAGLSMSAVLAMRRGGLQRLRQAARFLSPPATGSYAAACPRPDEPHGLE